MDRDPVVFLDTNVLLKAFGASLRGQPFPSYVADPHANRTTFEKCVFEAYLAFRGVGGKKPDEGRGRWAAQFLTSSEDPQRIAERVQTFHDGDDSLGFFWVSQITEAMDIDPALVKRFVRAEDRAEALAMSERIQRLRLEEDRFQALCDDFAAFLDGANIRVAPYVIVFSGDPIGIDPSWLSYGPHSLDSFARRTVIPPEDFEIVYAAMRIGTDILVTDDHRLAVCASSLGLNLPLSPTAFCRGDEYESKVLEWRSLRDG